MRYPDAMGSKGAFLVAMVGVALAGCPRAGDGAAGGDASAPAGTAPPSSASATSAGKPKPAPSPAGCDGLAPTPCVLQPGCILDQPQAGARVCRAAKNACERAVRHADIIGDTASLAGVTTESVTRAAAACRATSGCVVAGGRCSCPCAIFGVCSCACGGGYLARCTPEADAKALDGFPPR
jgi:hypothetical protein